MARKNPTIIEPIFVAASVLGAMWAIYQLIEVQPKQQKEWAQMQKDIKLILQKLK